MKNLIFFFFAIIITACNTSSKSPAIEGNYQFNIVFEGEETFNLPFDLSIGKDSSISFFNGKEEMKVIEYQYKEDSLIFMVPVFMTEFRLAINQGEFSGTWIKMDREEPVAYQVFSKKGAPRFEGKDANFDISGSWKTNFSYPDGDSYPAIGEFNQNGNNITGTFMTETGDYRFLEGVVSGDSIKFSTFDGSHAFLFLGKKEGEKVKGIFKASHTHLEMFEMEKDPTFILADADTLTFVKSGYDDFQFAFQTLKGDSVKYPSAKFENKVTIVQIMGSWCPNCMDETEYLQQVHEKYNSKGLEIVAVGFERFKDNQKNMEAIKRVKDHFGAGYTFALGGRSSKAVAAEAFPMLNHIISFPTAIFLDKKGKVRKIHTGFSGPGTSTYAKFEKETTDFIEKLLAE